TSPRTWKTLASRLRPLLHRRTLPGGSAASSRRSRSRCKTSLRSKKCFTPCANVWPPALGEQPQKRNSSACSALTTLSSGKSWAPSATPASLRLICTRKQGRPMPSDLAPLWQLEEQLEMLLDAVDTCPDELKEELQQQIERYLGQEMQKIDNVAHVLT